MIHRLLATREHTLRSWRMLGPSAPPPVTVAGQGPAVLAFHGFTGSPNELGPLVPALAAEGRAVRAPFLPGHGTCPTLLSEATFDGWLAAAEAEARALLEVHDALVLVGFSLGSLVALQLAATLGPTKVRGLVALAPPLHLRPALRWSLTAVGRLPRVPDLYLRKPALAQRWFGPAIPVSTYDRDPLRAAVEVAHGGRRTLAILGAVRVPILALHGQGDALCSPSNLTTLAKGVATADITAKVYTKSAHVLLADRERDAVTKDILGFVRRVAPLS